MAFTTLIFMVDLTQTASYHAFCLLYRGRCRGSRQARIRSHGQQRQSRRTPALVAFSLSRRVPANVFLSDPQHCRRATALYDPTPSFGRDRGPADMVMSHHFVVAAHPGTGWLSFRASPLDQTAAVSGRQAIRGFLRPALTSRSTATATDSRGRVLRPMVQLSACIP